MPEEVTYRLQRGHELKVLEEERRDGNGITFPLLVVLEDLGSMQLSAAVGGMRKAE